MWLAQFEDRLQDWYDLRFRCAQQPLDTCLVDINRWWFAAPWRPYYLHWDDHPTWPGPWDLLADNVYCDLARAAGIVYTILLLDRTDTGMIEIADTDRGNLVLVQGGKYILNWEPDEVLNINSTNIVINKSLDSSKLVHLLG
jgi:hypothetical protein